MCTQGEFDADEGVEFALCTPVVLEPEFDLAVQSQFFDTSLGDCQLFARQRDAGDVCAVVLRKVDRKATPAAADVEHARAGLQVELAGDQCALDRKSTRLNSSH